MNPTLSRTNFHIKTEAYEGPLELVLDLIEARKLLVNDLALASITEEFVAHIRAQEVFPIEEAATFLQIAATLILVKSKSLIPNLELTEEEQEDVDDLKRRLEALEKAREAARELGRIFGRRILFAAGERALEPVFAPSKDMRPDALAEALARVLLAREKVEQLPQVKVRPLITIEEMMTRLADRVGKAMSLSFKEFAAGSKERVEVIVSFLALLELVKQGAVAAEQFERHGDIRITGTAADSVPKYG